MRPTDENICLSILDYITPDEEGGGGEGGLGAGEAAVVDQDGAAKIQTASPTRALNMLANRVVRTVCVGSDEDLQVWCALLARLPFYLIALAISYVRYDILRSITHRLYIGWRGISVVIHTSYIYSGCVRFFVFAEFLCIFAC